MKYAMKRIMIISLAFPLALSGMEMPPRSGTIYLQPEKSYLEQLPSDLKKIILTNITPANFYETAQNIKALAATNKFFHDYINREDILKFIITTMAHQVSDVDELVAAEKLKNLPGMKNVQQWLEKRKVEIPKEQNLIDALWKQDITTVTRLLQEGVNPNSQSKMNKYTALSLSAWNNFAEIAQKLIDAGADINMLSGIDPVVTPTYAATIKNSNDVLAILLKAKANPDIPTTTKQGGTPLLNVAEENNIIGANMLLKAHANVNLQNNIGYTPLMKAAHHGNNEITKMLLNAQAKLDIQDNEGGNTALIWAVYNNKINTTKTLLQAGANPNLRSRKYGTALDLARKNNNAVIEKLLLQYGAQESQEEPR